MNNSMEKLHEECAVFGVSVTSEEAVGITYNGLLSMQHRGQEGAGIAAMPMHGNGIVCHKDVGLVGEVFTEKVIAKLPASSLAVGHNRYSTTGSNTIHNVQPFVTEFLTGRIATVHNGNVVNAKKIKKDLEKKGLDFAATSDSEVISSLIAYQTILKGNIIDGTIAAINELEGAFSLIIMCGDHKLIAVRDPNGFRPLCIGTSKDGCVVASESCALESCGFEMLRDIKPGEMVIIEDGKIIDERMYAEPRAKGICIFEYVYFARTDSVIDGLSVYEARCNMGRVLAKEHPVEADVVSGIPDSGLEAARGYAEASGIPLVQGFAKNRYIGRSFIFPTQAQRENAVKMKMNPLRYNVKGKRVILVDDSIVRGTTAAKIVSSMRNAGAKEVHMRISAPPFLHTCHFGTDIDDEANLIANHLTIDEICKKIGADSLGFISLDGLKQACEKCSLQFCTGCFDGNYGIPVSEYSKQDLEG